MNYRIRIGRLLVAIAAGSVSTHAMAQHTLVAAEAAVAAEGQAASAAPQSGSATESDSSTGADIIVTAQRRDESLSKTPVAVQVLTAEALDKAQIKTEQDLRFGTPGLQIRAGLSDTQLNFSLRGQSQDPFSDTRPGVLPYFNDVPLAGQGISTALYDLQSVQVLKGPQGTLFGRSATGGAVLYTTARPTGEFGGYVAASVGSRSTYRGEGAVNLPIDTEKLWLRVAGFYEEKNGFQRNLFDGKRVGDRHKEGGRMSLTFRPSDRIRNTFVYDYFHTNGQNTAPVIAGVLPFTGAGAPYFPAALLYSGTATPVATITGQCTLQAIAQFPGPCPPVNPAVSGFYNGYFADPRRTNTGISGVAAQEAADKGRIVNYNTQNIFRAKVHTIVNTTEIDVGDNATLKNIFGFQRNIADTAIDLDATPFGIQDYNTDPQRNNARQYTNELQLSGETFDGALSYVVGGFYADERLRYTVDLDFFDLIFGGQGDQYDHTLTSKTAAGYAQGTYKFGDSRFAATAGLRYTDEKVGVIIDPVRDVGRGRFCATPGFDCTQSTHYRNVSWTGGFQYQATSDLLLYVTSRRSYKSGGYNAFVAPLIGDATVGGNSFGEERATDVEGGLKFNGHLGDMPFRTNLAGYHVWTKNGQRAAYVFLRGNPGSSNVNVPAQRTYGFEFDAELRPIDQVTVGGTFNYTRARYTNGLAAVLADNALGGQSVTLTTFDQVPDTPRTSGSIFADVNVPVSGSMNVFAHGDLYFQSKIFTAARSGNFAGTTLRGYSIANFRIGIENPDAGWTLTGSVRNAFDRNFSVGGFSVGEIYQINTRIPGEPRAYSLEARFKF